MRKLKQGRVWPPCEDKPLGTNTKDSAAPSRRQAGCKECNLERVDRSQHKQAVRLNLVGQVYHPSEHLLTVLQPCKVWSALIG